MSVSPEEVKTRSGARLESYGMHSMYIPHANTVHMSHQGLSGTSVGPHTCTTFPLRSQDPRAVGCPLMHLSQPARGLGQMFPRLLEPRRSMLACHVVNSTLLWLCMRYCTCSAPCWNKSCPMVWLGRPKFQCTEGMPGSQEGARRGPNAMHPGLCAVSCAE